MFNIFKVEGLSMLPNFRPSRFVLTKRTNKICDNDVVVIKTDSNELIIKRVLDHNKDSLNVISDNKDYKKFSINRNCNALN